jgi:pyruvate dehydrogenase E1 component alpha subunit
MYTKQDLINYERMIANHWEAGRIKGPVHLSGGNEDQLIKIFKKVKEGDWVFSTWRSHSHALLSGINPTWLEEEILAGRSITIINKEHNFYSSAIVGAIIPIAVGVAMKLKADRSSNKVWCFIGDMTMETGLFWEAYKYSQNFNIPLQFVVEDNNLSVHTPTDIAWGKRMEAPENVIYYSYKMEYPHHGTGKWVNF